MQNFSLYILMMCMTLKSKVENQWEELQDSFIQSNI